MKTVRQSPTWLAIALAAGLAGCGAETRGLTDDVGSGPGSGAGGSPDSSTASGVGPGGQSGSGGDGFAPDPELDAFLTAQIEAGKVPALSAVVLHDGAVAWSGAYGLANVEDDTPATPSTLFLLASISKTIVATAVMQLEEEGRLALDDDVETLVPFGVRHPDFPNTPITMRMLLTHTSSIRDNWDDVLDPNYVPGDSPISLGDFVRGYVTPGGDYYYSTGNFAPGTEPGTVYEYSNVGVDLAAYVVEVVSGEPFDAYCRSHVFEPLGMDETSWRIADLDPSHVAMPYAYQPGSGYEAFGYYGYPDYPDGLLRTSAPQLARFLMAFIHDGAYEGARILGADTVATMKAPAVPEVDPEQGIVWYYEAGHTQLGHTGGDLGVATSMFFRPADGAGVIFLMNASPPEAQYDAIEQRLWEKADSL